MQNVANAKMHLQQHQTYPTTKADLVKTCNGLSDFSDADKKWFSDTLPEGSYNSADDVMNALGWKETPQQAS